MGKIFGILLIVVGVWVGLTIFTEGTDHAFGGVFAGAKTAADDGSGAPLPSVVKERVGEAFQAHEERTLKDTEE
jgi:hypothetical protein